MTDFEDTKQEKKSVWSKNGPKIIVGIVIIILLGAFLTYKILDFISDHTSTQYESILAKYYNALSRDDTNGQLALVTTDFINDMFNVRVPGGKFDLYSYNFNNPESTNNECTLLYAVNIQDKNVKLSYLGEARFVQLNGATKLKMIKKLYEGRHINLK